ncbi:hypothetical protein [Puniceicoccus vermicola]|uniref:Uncharacterized protein n=1 Tax=Puniceicoccus vermicola TaxID=388746 RepID=A0A7X1E480_9BACT|nr:hypothetical protein [Puniceicoccus vermicola]MBC2602300.1 hypothetical protein [Puniceicoccus vermicola]
MIFLKRFSLCLLLLVPVPLKGQSEDVLVSVDRIQSSELSPKGRVDLFFKVHEPIDARGSMFMIGCDNEDRARVRKEFPLDSLWAITVPHDFLVRLEKMKSGMERDEEIIDKGIDPRRISNAHVVPEIKMDEIQKAEVKVLSD